MLGSSLGLLLLLVGAHCTPTAHQVRSAIDRAKKIDVLRRELNLLDERDAGTPKTSRCPMMANFHGRRTSTDKEQDRSANVMLNAARLLLDEGFTHEDLQSDHVRAEFSRHIEGTCPLPAFEACDGNEKYRRADGSCNNLQEPRWGMTGVPQRRVLEPAYEDGIGSARSMSVSANGGPLPNPRRISNEVHRASGPEIRSPKITLHTFQMGQFLDHDIIATPVQDLTDCCSSNADNQNCLDIIIEGGNDRFEPFFVENYCMEFRRSAAVFCPDEFSKGQSRRQQTNEITSFIDASNVYDSSEKEMETLRKTGTGFMKTQDGFRLPYNPDQTVCKANTAAGESCSLAGDHRVNVIPSLTVYHNAFVLEHNRIAGRLQSSYPDPDTLFQETRKIVIGIMQKIVYDEFLPSFLSPTVLAKYNLLSTAPYQYDPSIYATISNSFGIAYRMGHTWIPRDMSLFGRNLRPINMSYETDATYNDPFLTYFRGNLNGMEGLAYWLSSQNSPDTDRIIEE